jgi:hypothetical protein
LSLSLGRNFNELYRVVVALQTTDAFSIAAPGRRQPPGRSWPLPVGPIRSPFHPRAGLRSSTALDTMSYNRRREGFMRKQTRFLAVAAVLALALSGCALFNKPPVAVISIGTGPFHVADQVAIIGTGSTDPNGDDLEYTWTLTAKPVTSTIDLVSTSYPSTQFYPDVIGTYTVVLDVTDGKWTDQDSVDIEIVPEL